MPRIFKKSNFLFALIVLVSTVPAIVLVIHEGDYEPFDFLIILSAASASLITIALLIRWLRSLIQYLWPEKDGTVRLSRERDLRRGLRGRR